MQGDFFQFYKMCINDFIVIHLCQTDAIELNNV